MAQPGTPGVSKSLPALAASQVVMSSYGGQMISQNTSMGGVTVMEQDKLKTISQSGLRKDKTNYMVQTKCDEDDNIH